MAVAIWTTLAVRAQELDTAAQAAIERSLAHGDLVWFHWGEVIIMSQLGSQGSREDWDKGLIHYAYLAQQDRFRRAGLLDVREIAQNALEQMGSMGARKFTVRPTTGLIELLGGQDSFDLLVRGSRDPNHLTVGIGASSYAIQQIVTNESYNGPLATPGEKFRIVLGVARSSSNPGLVKAGLTSSDETQIRFRVIVKHDPFADAWAVVASDKGPVGGTVWDSNNVR
jgi:hypothetical protein